MATIDKQPASTDRLRRKAIAARRAMSANERQVASDVIARRLLRCHEFVAARSIACYLPMRDEVDPGLVILRAWRAKKRVFCPVTVSRGRMVFRQLLPDTPLEMNEFGIWEPVVGREIQPNKLDLVVTPLAAFDDAHNRIGMGGGYFDRAFAFLRHRRHWRHPKLIGLAFDCQKVEKIVPNPWDIRLYRVLSEAK